MPGWSKFTQGVTRVEAGTGDRLPRGAERVPRTAPHQPPPLLRSADFRSRTIRTSLITEPTAGLTAPDHSLQLRAQVTSRPPVPWQPLFTRSSAGQTRCPAPRLRARACFYAWFSMRIDESQHG